MTGFGMASIQRDGYEVVAEIKTLNSKFADIMIRIPSQWSSLELGLRKKLTDGLVRGKISVSIEISSNKGSGDAIFDEELLAQYLEKFKKASENLGENPSDLFSLALHAPGVLKIDNEELTEDLTGVITEAVTLAIDKTNEFRSQEGAELFTKLLQYSSTIRTLLESIDPFDKARITQVEERLKQGLAKANLPSEVDQNRYEQELIYYIEKLDIQEEIVRLANHLDYFEEILETNEPNGKKLGFVSQEMGREINTIGSKANNSSIQRIVVEMKEELEKIKEQSLNIL